MGTGIAGLSAAWALGREHRVTVYEADNRLGGHAHTVDVSDGNHRVPVDTGFIVYNERNYPNLVRLFAHMGVASEPTDMSFSVSKAQGRSVSGPRPGAGRRAVQPVAARLPTHGRGDRPLHPRGPS